MPQCILISPYITTRSKGLLLVAARRSDQSKEVHGARLTCMKARNRVLSRAFFVCEARGDEGEQTKQNMIRGSPATRVTDPVSIQKWTEAEAYSGKLLSPCEGDPSSCCKIKS